MRIHVVLAAVVLLLTTANTVASDSDVSRIGSFRVTLTSGETIWGKDGELTGDSLTGRLSSGSRVAYPIDQISILRQHINSSRKGATTGLGIGLALGGALYVSAANKAAHDPGLEIDHPRAIIVVFGIAFAGGVIGALIGSASSQWVDVPLESYLVRREPVFRPVDRFLLRLKSGETLSGRKGILGDDGFTVQVSADSSLFYPMETISSIKRPTTHAKSYATIGVLTGLALGGTLAFIQAANSDDPESDKTRRGVLIAAGCTAGGGVLGALMGMDRQKWDNVPLDVTVGMDPNGATPQVRLTYSF